MTETIATTINGETRPDEITVVGYNAASVEKVFSARIGRGTARYTAYGYFVRRNGEWKLTTTTDARGRTAELVGWATDATNEQDQTRI